jgi:hypothetical protein
MAAAVGDTRLQLQFAVVIQEAAASVVKRVRVIQNRRARFRNGLTKSGQISINGVSCILKFPETKYSWLAERKAEAASHFLETLLHKTPP